MTEITFEYFNGNFSTGFNRFRNDFFAIVACKKIEKQSITQNLKQPTLLFNF